MKYRIFTRTWWKHNPDWPNGLEPSPGQRRYIATAYTEDEARAICRCWNETHNPGPYSLKAEYEDS